MVFEGNLLNCKEYFTDVIWGKKATFKFSDLLFTWSPQVPALEYIEQLPLLKKDKEHLTWILICRVQNVLLFPFTGRKMKSPEKQNPKYINL